MVQVNGLAGGLALALVVMPASAETQFKVDISNRATPLSATNKAQADGRARQTLPLAPISEVKSDPPRATDATCTEIRTAARTYQLPHEFLSRLIWQESRFNPKAVSPAGAIGIAQFMPATAQWRGLDNPFDPGQAIQHSARWLGELRQQFGNLGLAAAAYNAGPTRIQDWLDNKRSLPTETRAYVRSITGRFPEDWVGARDQSDEVLIAETSRNCLPESLHKVAARDDGGALRPPTKKSPEKAEFTPPKKPWALQLIGDRSKESAVQQFAALRSQFRSILGNFAPEVVSRRVAGRTPTFWYQVRISEVSRERATGLCSKLRSAGGACSLVKN